MTQKKLDEIIGHAELIQKLTTLVPARNGSILLRINKIITEAEMIKQLVQSLQENE